MATLCAALLAFGGIAALSSWHLGALRARVLEERRARIRLAVELAREVVAQHQRRAARGELSPAEAQRAALEALRALRFDRDDYFWVHVPGCCVLLHPLLPELEGHAFGDAEVAPYRSIFERFDRQVAESPDHAGFVPYMGPRRDHPGTVPKIAYVERVEPWGWVLGTAIFVDDLHSSMAGDHRQQALELVLVGLVLAAAAAGILWSLGRARRAAQATAQAQRAEALARLTAGLAHELNTPLQYLRDGLEFQREGFAALGEHWGQLAEVARAHAPGPAAPVLASAEAADLPYLLERIPETFASARQGLSRIATVVSTMRGFTPPSAGTLVPLDLTRSLEDLAEVVRGKCGDAVEVVTRLAPIPPITCHASQLELALLHVMRNGAQAAAAAARTSGARGQLSISGGPEGDEAVVTIADSGAGIPEDHRHRVFDPFFTTREPGQGLGQGLVLARAIVAAHGGAIDFVTAPGRGTTFTVRLPLGQGGGGGTGRAG